MTNFDEQTLSRPSIEALMPKMLGREKEDGQWPNFRRAIIIAIICPAGTKSETHKHRQNAAYCMDVPEFRIG